jgi:hypothetical protein
VRAARIAVNRPNTSDNAKGSQSNGGGFYVKKRKYATVMAIARPLDI